MQCAPSATTASDGSRVRGRLTALMWVAWCGDIDAAAALIFAGADTTSTNHRGYAAHLHARCVRCNKRAYMGRETAENMARENRKLAEYTEAVHRAMLRAAKSGDISRLQVLCCVLGPIRALTAKWPTLAAGAAATWRRCRTSRPVRLDRPGHRGRACVGRFAAAICAPDARCRRTCVRHRSPLNSNPF